MATENNVLPSIIPGNLVPIDRTIGNITNGTALTDAFFGLKANADATVLLPGFTELHITRTPLGDGSVITNAGALIGGVWLAEVLFWLADTVTALLPSGTYLAFYIDIIETGQTKRMTSEVGTVRVAMGGKVG